ncbi:HPP family protein [Actinophytocola sp.]|uniref:CBS domain-containing protein n=1 Tax=Actinophytocola sp. TaxID=1872138 RepID=UPI002D7E7C40|nr:CBS domain-containing protein [Actinophytocola sp.]HET9140856.1 CBS domain-containing protein [Actinophytocola sp.]
MNETTVATVMRRDPDAVRPHTPFKEILELLANRGAGAVPVVSATGAVIGLVSELDLLRGRPNRRRAGSRRLTAIELMTAPAPAIAPDTTIADAVRTFVRHGWTRVFVVDGGRLVGLLTARDLLSAFRRPDKEILAEVEYELDHPLHVSVDDGIVLLTGAGQPGAVLAPTLTRIAAIPGVIDVRQRTR